MPQRLMMKKLKLISSLKTYNLPRANIKKDILFIIGNWKAKIGSQEVHGATASLTMEYKMKQGKD